MTILRYEPWDILARFSRDFERLARLPATAPDAPQSVADWFPTIDIAEQQEQFVLHADLPGVQAEDIDVTLDKGVLTLKGKRHLVDRSEQAGFKRVERVSGQFYRSFSLPDTADGATVSAKLNHGVLEVLIPKQAQAQPRKIAVQAA